MNMIAIGFVGAVLLEVFGFRFLRFFLLYTTVNEGTCQVYVLFGKVVLILDQPGLHFLWPKLTWRALVLNLMGSVSILDMRMDQIYVRSEAVNSEEGAPMGVGVWYEMYIGDPVSYLFKNSDPKGSLRANVSNATVRSLSNLPLSQLLVDRHTLSQSLRAEVTQKSKEWGYHLGSVYIRKVHFRDQNMIHEIESKVVNRLRQVTASIKQDGENQVNVITNTAQRTASIEFAKAGAVRPQIVGQALSEIAVDPEVSNAMFEILETQKMLDNPGDLIVIPPNGALLPQLLGAR
jgi:regulator of protease activity HflC (stomatin/prohibitin superfamily)